MPMMRRPSRAALAFVIAALFVAARAGAADAPLPVCDTHAEDAAPDSGNPVFPARTHEVWLDVGYFGDWNPHHHPVFAPGLELVPLVTADQRWRLGMRLGGALGSWGDDRHGWLSLDLGLRARASFVMEDFFDVYAVAKGDGLMTLPRGPYFGARPGAGLGVRVARAVEVEATFDAALAIGATYTDSDPRFAPGFGVSVGFDMCFPDGCARTVPPVVHKDFTCSIYERAVAVCSASAEERAELCDAVATAMDGTVSTPRQREDATAAFLRAVAEGVRTPALAARLEAMRAAHREMSRRRDAEDDAERAAARGGRTTVEHCAYAPYAAELRDAFGCAPEGTPACALPASCRR